MYRDISAPSIFCPFTVSSVYVRVWQKEKYDPSWISSLTDNRGRKGWKYNEAKISLYTVIKSSGYVSLWKKFLQNYILHATAFVLVQQFLKMNRWLSQFTIIITVRICFIIFIVLNFLVIFMLNVEFSSRLFKK